KSNSVKTINVLPHQLITKMSVEHIKIDDNNLAQSNIADDVLKIAVIERHRASGNIGLGFVKGFGLQQGAIASTVAHDSHNMIVIGTNDEDMYYAAKELVKTQGGKIVVNNGKTLAHLPLPTAGLMSDNPLEEVIKKVNELNIEAKEIGCTINDPFMSMACVSLSIIP